MREIIFRGKLAHSEKWVQGNLIISNKDNPYIYPQDLIEQDGHHLLLDTDEAFWVIPETVGQFTGLTDKNGVKIFEGDLISCRNFNGEEYTAIYEVLYDKEGFCLKMLRGNKKAMEDRHLSSFGYINDDNSLKKGEVIGNIHDNPELLQKQEAK